jgi:uncharacterized protein (TIGR04222 family)
MIGGTMTRKLFLFLLVLAIALFTVSPVLAAKSYRAERFDAEIAIQENGAAIVTETVEFHFEGDPFTFAFREIAADNTDGITFLDASLDGAPMPQGTQPGQVEVEAGDPLKVKWHFPPTANAAHTFVVRYRVDGLVRKGDADSIIWRVIPEDHDYAIKRSTTTLTFPPKAVLLGEPSLSRPFTSILTDGPIRLIATDIAKDDDLVLTARFAPDSLTKLMPKWQERNQLMDAAALRAAPIALVVGLLTLLLGSLGLWRFASIHRRELADSPAISSTTPPTDLPPALMGKLTGKAHGFMGAIFDLAQRGVLEVREEKGFWGTKHLLIRKESNVSLSPYESSLLDAIFKPGEDTVQMSEIARRVASKNTLLDETLEQELVQRGWRDPRRRSQQTGMRVLGLVMLFGSFALFVFSILGVSITSDYLNLAPLVGLPSGISLAMFPLSIALLIYTSRFSTLTPSGEEQAARWKDFEKYLKDVSKNREPAVYPDYFERYLAYAAAFGLGTDWARHFQTLKDIPLPVWFRAADGSSPTFGAIVAVMHTSDSTGTGGGAGGVSGASGGGASGAG